MHDTVIEQAIRGGSRPAAAAQATETLIARYHGASGADRARYVAALGNGGAAAALPVLRDTISRGGPAAETAVYSLRFAPGAEADDRVGATYLARRLLPLC